MCGIVGVWHRGSVDKNRLRSDILAMNRTLEHRGPDGEGVFVRAESGLGLGHRRLAIVDLSDAGAQPMKTDCGDHHIVLNGEIYNHQEIADELADEGETFEGHSDTEVLLKAIARWGVDGALHRVVGMFAFAYWNEEEERLWIARDRMGEKPLYYSRQGAKFFFGSELKALVAHPDFRARVRAPAMAEMLSYGYIGAPRTIYEDVYKLAPGHAMVFSWRKPELEPYSYWRFPAEDTQEWVASDVANAVEQSLEDAVRLQMEADVPLGAFLSGGVDSSLIVSLMQKNTSRPVKTFSIGFDSSEFDEAPYAAAVAQHLGTEHHELRVSVDDALQILPELATIYDEPMGDASQMPTWLVAHLTRQHVTVSLSGDGGDELFGGYNTYGYANKLWHQVARVPLATRRVGGVLWQKGLGAAAERMQLIVPSRFRRHASRALMAGSLIDSTSMVDFGDRMARHFRSSRWPMLFEPPYQRQLVSVHGDYRGGDELANVMRHDASQYMPDDILVKVDRASMAVSLESRAPLLDHRVVELAMRLPTEMKIRNGQTKWPLREVLYRYVPKSLIERPKKGFSVPLASWFRSGLRVWGEDLLHSGIARRYELDQPMLMRIWNEHQSEKVDHSVRLYSALTLLAWLRRWG